MTGIAKSPWTENHSLVFIQQDVSHSIEFNSPEGAQNGCFDDKNFSQEIDGLTKTAHFPGEKEMQNIEIRSNQGHRK